MANNATRENTYGKDGIDGAGVGRTLGLSSLILGIGALLFSWVPIMGSVFGIVAFVLGITAIVKSLGAKKRVTAAGREARTGGAFGLGLIGVFTGAIAIAINLAIYFVAQNAIDACEHIDKTTAEYQKCLSDELGTK
ncbi:MULTISPECIES: hypothetical protein [unclassified Corynebacterium]|uniref:hypothetical protein n=1 Tax=unclassified Corynebacterium TaxID=2624378 RepID=UPI0030A16335